MSVHAPGTHWYNAVWRWHFYAALLCVPLVIWLACTGTIYLWRPQIEAMLDRPYDTLPPAATRARAEEQVRTALAAVPGSSFTRYQLPETASAAARVIVSSHGEPVRVYVDPYRLRVLKLVGEEDRPMRLVFHLHGELLAGAWGSYLVETAACWAIVMLLTGVYLWWPRGARGPGGVLYPRLRGGKRRFWRDIHAVSGIWVSLFACLLIVTGLPWASAWGSYFKEIRQVTGTIDGPLDWTIGGRPADAETHAGHVGKAMPMMPATPPPLAQLDRVVSRIAPLGIAPPVMIAPPSASGGGWVVTSEAANRPLRTRIIVDGESGKILSRKDFAQRHWIDRAVGYGIAVHEGALFGLANQLLGTATALLLVTLAVSGAVLWWRRRPQGLLGAPIPLNRPRFGALLVGAIVALGLLLPLFGASLVLVLLAERLVLRCLPLARQWLGLRTPA